MMHETKLFFFHLLYILGTGIGLGVHSPALAFVYAIAKRSFPSLVLACGLPKFSLKCNTASNNLITILM